ncbi:MAG: hypothetical protein AAF566_10425 [Pseudomonadota bacterium]
MTSPFAGIATDDIASHYAELRAEIERGLGQPLPEGQGTPDRLREAEALLGASLGAEARAFLTLLSDLVEADAWEAALSGIGVVKADEPVPYRFQLRALSELDPREEGLGFMNLLEDGKLKTVFSLPVADATSVRGGILGLSYDASENELSYSGRHSSMQSFALRFFGPKISPGQAGMGFDIEDPDNFVAEAAACLGTPAELGGGALHYQSSSFSVIYEPIGVVNVHMTVTDPENAPELSPGFLAEIDFTEEGYKRALERART